MGLQVQVADFSLQVLSMQLVTEQSIVLYLLVVMVMSREMLQ